ncbi:hypothetical protein INR49_019868 [Caranx melampygus]|nr:hypothetical protein INR49_019868 [Caranx melampygus]
MPAFRVGVHAGILFTVFDLGIPFLPKQTKQPQTSLNCSPRPGNKTLDRQALARVALHAPAPLKSAHLATPMTDFPAKHCSEGSTKL